MLILPMVGFDAGGGRLGYGGGYYDRTLAGMGDALAVGFALEAQRVEAIPQEPTDITLPYIITDAGVFGADGTV